MVRAFVSFTERETDEGTTMNAVGIIVSSPTVTRDSAEASSEPEELSAFAVITASPAPTPVTLPAESTVAEAESENQATLSVPKGCPV